jgi:hypothetical protein
MAAKLTRLTQKIAIQLHLVAESCTIWSCRFMRPVHPRITFKPRWNDRYIKESCLALTASLESIYDEGSNSRSDVLVRCAFSELISYDALQVLIVTRHEFVTRVAPVPSCAACVAIPK